MGNATVAIIFLAVVNVLMWISMLSITSMNPSLDLNKMCYTSTGTLLQGQITGTGDNDTLVGNTVDNLPTSTQGAVQAGSSGGFVTDLFNNIIGFFKSVGKGLSYAMAIINAPSNILKCIGLPIQISNILGALWNIISLFVLISYIWWRD